MRFFADSVHDLINALELKDVCVVGHSMGGQVALTMLAAYPGCAASLVLCAPAGFEQFTTLDRTMYFTSLQMFDFMSSDEQNLRSVIENSFYHATSQGETVIKELIAIMRTYQGNYYKKMVDGCIKSMLEDAVYDKLPLIKQPTLVMFGNKDALIPNKMIHHITTHKLAADAVKKMPAATLHMIANCGHFLQWEKAEEANVQIIRFLEEKK